MNQKRVPVRWKTIGNMSWPMQQVDHHIGSAACAARQTHRSTRMPIAIPHRFAGASRRPTLTAAAAAASWIRRAGLGRLSVVFPASYGQSPCICVQRLYRLGVRQSVQLNVWLGPAATSRESPAQPFAQDSPGFAWLGLSDACMHHAACSAACIWCVDW